MSANSERKAKSEAKHVARQKNIATAMRLKAEGKTVREIAEEMGTKMSSVNYMLYGAVYHQNDKPAVVKEPEENSEDKVKISFAIPDEKELPKHSTIEYFSEVKVVDDEIRILTREEFLVYMRRNQFVHIPEAFLIGFYTLLNDRTISGIRQLQILLYATASHYADTHSRYSTE